MARALPKPGEGETPAAAAPEKTVQRLRAPIATIALVGMAGLGMYDKSIFAFVLASLMPSAIAWFLDRTPTMVLTRTVLPLNLSCVIPFSLQIYYADSESQQLNATMDDMWSWITVYSASGFGYLLYYLLPKIIAIYISLRTEKKRRDLQEKQEELREEWGVEVGD